MADAPENPAEVEIAAEEAGTRLDVALAARRGVSRAEIQRLLVGGHVRPSAGAAAPARRVVAGERYAVTIPPPVAAEPQGEDIPLAVLHEDDALIVIDKPAGLVVHPAAGHAGGTLVNALIAHCGDSLSGIGGVKRPGIVHRLDKGTSGVMVVAKTDAAHRGLAAQFADHGRTGPLERAYLAFAWGAPHPARGRIEAALARSPADRQKIAVSRGETAREAVTDYATTATYPPASAEGRAGAPHAARPRAGGDHRGRGGGGGRGALAAEPVASRLECRLLTGRTHQIRVHLAHIGHPLVGDPDYGAGFRTRGARLPEDARRLAASLGRPALHAQLLGFAHPSTGRAVRFTAPLPADLVALEAALAAWR